VFQDDDIAEGEAELLGVFAQPAEAVGGDLLVAGDGDEDLALADIGGDLDAGDGEGGGVVVVFPAQQIAQLALKELVDA
jgi:hypothetical protein